MQGMKLVCLSQILQEQQSKAASKAELSFAPAAKPDR